MNGDLTLVHLTITVAGWPLPCSFSEFPEARSSCIHGEQHRDAVLLFVSPVELACMSQRERGRERDVCGTSGPTPSPGEVSHWACSATPGRRRSVSLVVLVLHPLVLLERELGKIKHTHTHVHTFGVFFWWWIWYFQVRFGNSRIRGARASGL